MCNLVYVRQYHIFHDCMFCNSFSRPHYTSYTLHSPSPLPALCPDLPILYISIVTSFLHTRHISYTIFCH
jgi:hypothetical protein